MSVWAFDRGWKNPASQPFSIIPSITTHDVVILTDQFGIEHGYSYVGMNIVRADDVSVMNSDLGDQVTLIGSAGDDVRDATTNKIIGSTHNSIYIFKPIKTTELSIAGLH
ncbi:MAG: sortase [bacterium]|nr:sortase [bacterium]